MSEPTTVHARLRRGICDDRCHVRDARSGCDCAEAADLIDALVEALKRSHHACVTLDNYGAMNRVMLITTEALARAKGEPK